MGLTPEEEMRKLLEDGALADPPPSDRTVSPAPRVANLPAPPPRREAAAVPSTVAVPPVGGAGEREAQPAVETTVVARTEPEAPVKAKQAKTRKAPVASGTNQVTPHSLYLRLSVRAAAAVREEAEALRATQTEVILGALRSSEAWLMEPSNEPSPPTSGSGFLPPPRPAKQTQARGPQSAVVVYLTNEESAAIKALALATHRSQVQLVEDACTQHFKLADPE
jgi:hypothetical protein